MYEYDGPDEAAGKICGCTEERQCRTAWLAESLDMRVRLILKLLQWDADYVGCNALLYWGLILLSFQLSAPMQSAGPRRLTYIHTRTAAADERLVIAGPSMYVCMLT